MSPLDKGGEIRPHKEIQTSPISSYRDRPPPSSVVGMVVGRGDYEVVTGNFPVSGLKEEAADVERLRDEMARPNNDTSPARCEGHHVG